MMWRRTSWRGPTSRRWHPFRARAWQIEREITEFQALLAALGGA